MAHWARSGIARIKRKLAAALWLRGGRNRLKVFHESNEDDLSDDEIRAFMRHDAHRIEKSFYNGIFENKRDFYEQRRSNVLRSIEILNKRGADPEEITTMWAAEIANGFEDLESLFINPKSTPPKPISSEGLHSFMNLVRSRRSSRVWAQAQPSAAELEAVALTMIEAACWAPNSGNRQPVRFKIITRDEEKKTLAGLKEEHCFGAPCLIFVGADRRFYGGLGENEAGIYIDSGAAIMQMVLAAHAAHYGVCWNHLAADLIASRPGNKEVYGRFVTEQSIPDYIEPIAIIAFGIAAFHPPVPPRMKVNDFLLSDPPKPL